METFTQSGVTLRRWRIGASTFTACPERGARLMSWTMDLPNGRREIIAWPDDAPLSGDAKTFGSIRGGNPVLFPFAGRCHVDGAPGWWIDPEGVKRPYPQHGVARQGTFEISASGPDFFSARLAPDAAANDIYPYAYEFVVTYRFRELGFTVEYGLTNRDTRPIPWGPGHHFYFKLPWHKGLRRGDYVLNLDAKKALRHLGDGSFTPNKELEKPPVNFDHAGLSDTLFTKIKGDSLTFGPHNGEENIRIGFDAGVNATVVTWTPSEDSPLYCVEPWACLPNSQANKFSGARRVFPGGTDRYVVTVDLA